MMRIALTGLILFTVFIYFEPTLFFPSLGHIRAALLLSIVAFLVALGAGARPPRAVQNKLLIGVLFIAAVATLASPFPYEERNEGQLANLSKAIALYFLVSTVIASKRYLERFFYVTLGFGFIVSATSLLTQRAGIQSLKGDSLYRMVNYFGGIGADPNEFGAFMLAFFPLPLAMIEKETSLTKKLALSAIALSFLLCIVRSRSRGAFVGLLVILTLVVWELRPKYGMILLLTALGTFTYLYTSPGYWERMSALFAAETLESDDSAVSRKRQILYAFQFIQSYPLTGVGPGNFVPAKKFLLGLDAEDKFTNHVAHNTYLGLGAEIGIAGMALFILSIITSVADGYRSARILRNREHLRRLYQISKGIRLGLIGLAVGIFFLSQQHNALLYQWMAFVVALKKVSRQEESRGSGRPEVSNSPGG